MRSINHDIRARSKSTGRTVAIILGVAALALSLSFGLSFLPAIVSAHNATFAPSIVETNGQVYVTVQANIAAGDFVKGILAGFSPDALTCHDVVDVTNDTGSTIITDVGELEFHMNAPAAVQEGGYPLYYQVTGSDDCQTFQGTLLSTVDVLDVIEPEPTNTTTSENFVVSPSNMNGWYFWNDKNDTFAGSPGALVSGPTTAPLGTGSVELGPLTDNGATAAGHSVIATNAYAGTPIANITSLGYSTYQPGPTLAIAMQFDVKYRTTDVAYGGRLVFEPYQNGAVTVGSGWQTWSPLAGKWWASKTTAAGTGGICGQATPCTWSEIKTAFPQATIAGRFLLKAGSNWDGFDGNADKVFLTLDNGTNATTTTYDFEPTVVVAPACDGSTTFDAFGLGTVNGQGGWISTGSIDQAVVSNTYGFTTFGCQTLRISNAVISGGFGDQIFSPSATNEAGETVATTTSLSGGLRQPHFEAQFDLASAVPSALQAGAMLSVSPDRGDGARMSYLRFEDQADGIHVFFADYATSTTFSNVDIATLDRTTAHAIKFVMDFVDGASNDVVKVYVDGVLKATGTSWEDYFRFDAEQAASGNQVPTVDSLLFRQGGAVVAAPLTSGKGFLIDNVSVTTSGNAPVVTTPSNTGGSNPGNGGGGPIGGPNGIGFVNTNPQGGQVLGASTDLPAGCSAYISGYLKKGATGEQVKKLQSFLNQNLNILLPVTGLFGSMTLDAVSKFQVKYRDEILKPWFVKGLSKDMNPSGYAYKTTIYKINLLQCATLNTPEPQLP